MNQDEAQLNFLAVNREEKKTLVQTFPARRKKKKQKF